MMKELDFIHSSFRETAQRRRRTQRNTRYLVGLVFALGCLHILGVSRMRSSEATLAAFRTGDEARHLQLGAIDAKTNVLEGKLEMMSQIDDDAPLDACSRRSASTDEPIAIAADSTVSPCPATDRTTPGPGNHGSAWLAATDVQVGVLLGRLTESPLFDDVRMRFSRQAEVDGREMREFELKFKVRRVAISH
jgi:hypothetical protein